MRIDTKQRKKAMAGFKQMSGTDKARQKPRLRDIEQGEVALRSYKNLHSHGNFSEDLLEQNLRGVSAQKYEKTLLGTASAFGVSPSSISRKLSEFQERSLLKFNPFAIFLDTIHKVRGYQEIDRVIAAIEVEQNEYLSEAA